MARDRDRMPRGWTPQRERVIPLGARLINCHAARSAKNPDKRRRFATAIAAARNKPVNLKAIGFDTETSALQ
jgi:hypothetical protein